MFQRFALSTHFRKNIKNRTTCAGSLGRTTGLAVPGKLPAVRGAGAGRATVMRGLRGGAPANNGRLPALCRAAGGGQYRGVRRLPATPVAFRRRPGVVPLPTAGGPPDSEP